MEETDKLLTKVLDYRDLRWSSGWIWLFFHCRGWVWSWVGELRSYVPLCSKPTHTHTRVVWFHCPVLSDSLWLHGLYPPDPLSMALRQALSGLLLPLPEDLPDLGLEPESPVAPALPADLLLFSASDDKYCDKDFHQKLLSWVSSTILSWQFGWMIPALLFIFD